eukprot:GFYU01027085.1.p1 GENE.GFYU01027085.1~~GFYU01027085.1.p1  ORF type:complete len:120 (+),score=27.72 GFYU01027085.1:82-441(+)
MLFDCRRCVLPCAMTWVRLNRSHWEMAVAFGTNGGYVASGGLENVCKLYKLQFDSTDLPIRIINPTRCLEGHDAYVSSVVFQSESRVLTASGDATCRLWDVEQGDYLSQYAQHDGDVMS